MATRCSSRDLRLRGGTVRRCCHPERLPDIRVRLGDRPPGFNWPISSISARSQRKLPNAGPGAGRALTRAHCAGRWTPVKAYSGRYRRAHRAPVDPVHARLPGRQSSRSTAGSTSGPFYRGRCTLHPFRCRWPRHERFRARPLPSVIHPARWTSMPSVLAHQAGWAPPGPPDHAAHAGSRDRGSGETGRSHLYRRVSTRLSMVARPRPTPCWHCAVVHRAGRTGRRSAVTRCAGASLLTQFVRFWTGVLPGVVALPGPAVVAAGTAVARYSSRWRFMHRRLGGGKSRCAFGIWAPRRTRPTGQHDFAAYWQTSGRRLRRLPGVDRQRVGRRAVHRLRRLYRSPYRCCCSQNAVISGSSRV